MTYILSNNSIAFLLVTVLIGFLKTGNIFFLGSFKFSFAKTISFYSLIFGYQSFAMAGENSQMEALKALVTENERVKRYGFSEAEFERAKKEYVARLEKAYKDRNKQESNRIIGQYVSHFLEDSPIPGTEWTYEFAKNNLDAIKL